nr:DEAD/DEAH box helicase family protein [Numidum massiliense]
MRRIFYSEKGEDTPPVDRYDCIIVDEAHRGYTLELDREYVSKYRQVLDYFDAARIGLIATPACHTTEIFGKPVYT